MSDADEYFVWMANPNGGFCQLDVIENVDDGYELTEGVSRAKDFPSDAQMHMSKSFRKDVKLPDNCLNLESLIVVSNRVRDWLAKRELPQVEFLPVSIINHKGKVASSEYTIVNPLSVQDCIDKQKSDVSWSNVDPDFISSVFKLVLRPKEIDRTIPLFRLKHSPTVVLVQSDLARALEAAKFTGLHFVPVHEYVG